MQYFFIAYDYDTNYIFANPINNLKDEIIIKAFKSVFNELKNIACPRGSGPAVLLSSRCIACRSVCDWFGALIVGGVEGWFVALVF